MTIFLLIVIAVLVGLLIQQRRYRLRLNKAHARSYQEIINVNTRTLQAYQQLYKDYLALEEGNQEIIDNYENDLLEYKEQMAAARNSASYDRQMREEVEKKLEQANLIIEKHSDKCDILVEDIADMLIAEAMPPSE